MEHIASRNITAAEDELRAALRLKPNSFEARLNLGGLYLQRGKVHEAETWFRKAMEVSPNDPQAHYNLALTLRTQERTAEAIEHLEHVCLLAPAHEGAQLELALLRLNICDWSRRDRDVQTIRSFFVKSLEDSTLQHDRTWTLNQIPPDSALQAAVARNVAEGIAKRIESPRQRCAFEFRGEEPERLKIGYVSPDFRRHAVGSLIHGMFKHHDRDRFEIHAYSLCHADDVFQQEVQRDCEFFHDVEKVDPETLARRIHADGIHILIDMAGYTTFTKPEVFALQPAPVQIQYMGFLNTMGAPYYHYTIADSVVMTDELAAHYTENIVYMPDSFMVASSFEVDDDSITRAEVGLPEDAVVFCSFNTPYKLDPDVFDSWASILNAVEGSVLWLYVNENELAENNIRIEARLRGIAEERIIFATRMEPAKHLARMQLADLFLDTFLYNAGATAAGALFAGLPLITRYGTTVLSRMGASMLNAVGLEELVCATTEIYESKAIELGNNPNRLHEIRQHLKHNRDTTALFDTARFVSSLEKAFEAMWANERNGKHEDLHP